MPARRKPEKVRELHGSRPRPPSPETANLANTPEPPDWLPEAALKEHSATLGQVTELLRNARVISATTPQGVGREATLYARIGTWRGTAEALERWAKAASEQVKPKVQKERGLEAAYWLINSDVACHQLGTTSRLFLPPTRDHPLASN
jgi:hypothetical protein